MNLSEQIKMLSYQPPIVSLFCDYLSKLYPNKEEAIREITFQVTEDCCMACTYCYQHHKTSNKMTWDVAKIFIDQLLDDKNQYINTKNTFGLCISFIGGEPLLEIKLIKQIIEYTLNKMIINNHPWLYYIRFSITSNGLLYNTEEVQELFRLYNNFISFGITLDGSKDLHDKCRKDLQGNGTYNRVINSLLSYKKKYKVLPGAKITLSPDNINYTFIALMEFIKIGYIDIPINCIFEKGWNYSHATILYNELKKLADYLIDNNLYNKVNIRLFEESYFKPLTEDNNENWCGGTDMKCLSIDYKGDIYPCIRYMESSLNGKQKPLIVGNIFQTEQNIEQINNEKIVSNITRRSQSTDKCFNCPIAGGCAWCSGYNYEEFGTPNKRATYICPMHQATSLANVYYWNKIYKKLDINKSFKMYIPKDWALNIIDEQEYNMLLKLSEKGD